MWDCFRFRTSSEGCVIATVDVALVELFLKLKWFIVFTNEPVFTTSLNFADYHDKTILLLNDGAKPNRLL